MIRATIWKTALVSMIALLFAACSNSAGIGHGRGAARPNPSQTAAAANATPSAAGTDAAPLQAVVQRANDEQQQAISRHNPSAMHDTATDGYYQQLVQTNNDLVNGGVKAIQLVKLAWGPVSVQGAQAQLTTDETWRSTYADGSTDEATDRNVYTLVNQGGAWRIQADVHPNSGLDQPAPTSRGAPGPSTRPVPSAGVAPAGSGQSQNWSGYAADGGNFTAVSGTWTISTGRMTDAPGADATWVGIGGVRSHDLIQAGTDATVTGNGAIRYEAWVETLPQASRPVPLKVSAGDSVSVSISEEALGQWLVDLKNNTTGQSYRTTEQYDSTHSSAEWVEEAPNGGRRQIPLDNFGVVGLSNGSAVKDGKTVSIAQAGARPITMFDRAGQAVAVPSSLGRDGKSFSVSGTGSAATNQSVRQSKRQ